ncbi:MAG: amino acid adenylation domain-containing protein [Williamsia sp.]|nr:amino acid adenylation domain-containing protein [Williamsia sp.]
MSFSDEELSIHVKKGKQIDKQLLSELRTNKPYLIHYFKTFTRDRYNVSLTSIPKLDRSTGTKLPLSFAQERMLFIDRLEGSVQYHLPAVLKIKGTLDAEALGRSLQHVVDRHEILRTCIAREEDRSFQQIKEKGGWKMDVLDRKQYKEDAGDQASYIENLVSKPFDITSDYPIRATLICMGEQAYVLVIVLHHIAADAWSNTVLVREVMQLYDAFTTGRIADLAPLPVQYADYAHWQRSYLQPEVLDSKLAYWKNKLTGVQTLQLPINPARTSIPGTCGEVLHFNIDKQTSVQLLMLSQEQGATLFMTLLATYKILLHRYCNGQQDICVGTSIASRQQKELESLIGFFVNSLALRDSVLPTVSFVELLGQVKTTVLEAYEHQQVPFEKVVEAVVSERDTGRNPLFQVMLVLANTPPAEEFRLNGIELTREDYVQSTTKFDITFFITETSQGLQGKVQYASGRYQRDTIERMITHFKALLKSVLKEPQERIGRLSMFGPGEKGQLLHQFSSCRVNYPPDKSIAALFEEQVQRTPQATALVFERQTLTYTELNKRANQLAHYLQNKGVQSGVLVPVLMERSATMLIAVLAVLKAGGAYVPIDHDCPQERIDYMLLDCKARIVVTSSASSSSVVFNTAVEIIEADTINGLLDEDLPLKPSARQLAYVIYTSGSTGKPKGVMVEQRSLVDYYYGLNQRIRINDCRSFALLSTIATDLGNTVIYASLLSGGALHVFSKKSASDGTYLQRYFREHSIDCVKIVPSHWKALCGESRWLLPSRLLVFGGEILQAQVVEEIYLSGASCRVVNHYGPTETTIGKLVHEVALPGEYNTTVPVGKPFSNTKVYVLTDDMQLCPVDITGELYIAGDGLARGYLNNEALTREKFVSNPFDKQEAPLMYSTGDRVKWLPDGNLAFIGRADDQVKIRGYRVEPAEVQTVLAQCKLVKQAAVIARQDSQSNYRLVAYVVAQDHFDRDDLTSYLKEKLPDYMIPSLWVEMESIPLTANGKTDRHALPEAATTAEKQDEPETARNEQEAKLATIWQEVLEVEQVGIHQNFFELGGHSLLAVRLVSLIRKAFAVELPIGDVFDYPSIVLLAGRLDQLSGTTLLPAVERVHPRPDYVPLSYSQERLWFIDQLSGSIQYHIPAVLRLKGNLDKEALRDAMKQIIDRHEVLRTVIRQKEGAAYQLVKSVEDWQVQDVDGSRYLQDPGELQHSIAQLINQPFDLSEDYMVRAKLIRLQQDDHVLVVTLHHIASDGWSASIIVNELAELYNARLGQTVPSLAPLPVQYADYALWQRNTYQTERLHQQLEYWQQKLAGVSPLELQTDYTRPAVQSTKGAVASGLIDAALKQRLHLLSQQQEATPFMVLLAVFNILLYRYTGQQDICIGTPVAGRQQHELENLIGFFVNTLVLRNELTGRETFIELLQHVKVNTLQAYANQEVPFEKVVEAVVKERDMSRSPLFQILFVLQNTPDVPVLLMEGIHLSHLPNERTTSQFDISFLIAEHEDELRLTIEYSTDLFSMETIERMMFHYTNLLSAAVSSPGSSINTLQMLATSEEQQLLFGFNDTAMPYPEGKCFIDLFEAQVTKTPHAIACLFEEEHLTYQQLSDLSTQLAHVLHSKGVKEETLVPICIERSLNMIVAVLGVLKSGAAYVPVDPLYPAERISYMLEDTGAKIVVSSRKCRPVAEAGKSLQVIELDVDQLRPQQLPLDNIPASVSSNQLAYVIYTSGSTGKPKGVMLEHSNLTSFICWCQREFSSSRFDMVYASTSLCFDLSVFEMFYPLSIGKPVRIIESGLHIGDFLQKDTHVLVNTVPAVIQYLLQAGTDLSNISVLNMAGEPIPPYVQQNLNLEAVEVRNLYGPTECTTYSTVYRLRKNKPVLIGKPIANTSLYILRHNNLVPLSMPGEICIGGAGVARGYLAAARKEEKFIQHPFDKAGTERIYRTGDWGRWLPDGNLEYLGRIDDQVKIMGYRIEPGEIETILGSCELVKQAVVIARADNLSNKRLIGYVVPHGAFNKDGIVNYLKSRLPAYMIPAFWVEMGILPITDNGKINKKALPDPDPGLQIKNAYVPPGTGTEHMLAEIWKRLLNLPRIGIHDNFFELGGHSLMAIRMVAMIKKEFGRIIPIPVIFKFSTIEELGNYLEWENDLQQEEDEETAAFQLVKI